MKATNEVRRCRICGCTDEDCSGCIERSGQACHWVAADLCSACVSPGFSTAVRIKRGDANIASARVGGKTYRCSATCGELEAAAGLAHKVAIAVGAESARICGYKCLSVVAARAVLVVVMPKCSAARGAM
jgi:hypothetical protein